MGGLPLRAFGALSVAGAILALLPLPSLADSESRDDAAARALIRDGVRELEAGQIDRATRAFERAIRISPSDPTGYLHLARAHGAARRFTEGRKVLAKAEIHAHGDHRLQYDIELVRGDLHRDEGNLKEARAAYERAAELRFLNRDARRRLEALEESEE